MVGMHLSFSMPDLKAQQIITLKIKVLKVQINLKTRPPNIDALLHFLRLWQNMQLLSFTYIAKQCMICIHRLNGKKMKALRNRCFVRKFRLIIWEE